MPASLAQHPTHFDLQEDACASTRQIANHPHASVVPSHVRSTAATADRFFERRLKVMTRAVGSPNTPRTVGSVRNPGKLYASHSRRFRFADLAIQTCCQIQQPRGMHDSLKVQVDHRSLSRDFTLSIPRRPCFLCDRAMPNGQPCLEAVPTHINVPNSSFVIFHITGLRCSPVI